MANDKVAGAKAEIFNEMTRETIARLIARMNTEQLIELLGHIIARQRRGA